MDERKKNLFREQAIDEFNSKLNGEVILNSALNKRLIAVMLLSLVLVFSFFNFIKINESNVVSGWFYFDEKNKTITVIDGAKKRV